LNPTPETLAQPTTPEEQAEVEYGKHLIWRLVGATITSFGANVNGEIYLSTIKDGKADAVIVGKDERGDIALFEAEQVEVPAP
jgi:hypothetical protein